MSDTAQLPDFEHPPVARVVLGVSFQPLAAIRGVHIGVFWSESGLADEFPVIEEFAYRPATLEQFQASADEYDIELLDGPNIPRVVFASDDRATQVAVQRDQIQVSWHRHGTGEYPRYPSVRHQFARILELWERFLDLKALGTLRPVQAEISYENDLTIATRDVAPSELVDLEIPDPASGQLEGYHLAQRRIVYEDEVPIARFYVMFEAEPEDESPELALIVRGPVSDVSTMWDFLDRGHELIVRGFDAIATPKAHEIWGRVGS